LRGQPSSKMCPLVRSKRIWNVGDALFWGIPVGVGGWSEKQTSLCDLVQGHHGWFTHAQRIENDLSSPEGVGPEWWGRKRSSYFCKQL
jgi:hypothetical protein